MARKKGAAAVAEPAPPVTLEDLKKKLIARGKSQGSLTYEEISAAFDVLEEISPEQLEEFFEELAASGIELAEEPKDEKAEAEREETHEPEAGKDQVSERDGAMIGQKAGFFVERKRDSKCQNQNQRDQCGPAVRANHSKTARPTQIVCQQSAEQEQAERGGRGRRNENARLSCLHAHDQRNQSWYGEPEDQLNGPDRV